MSVLKNGVPKYVRVYSNEGRKDETLDCITVVFGKKRVNGEFMYIGASKTGSGFYQHGFSDTQIDRPSYGHLGKKIRFEDLDPGLQERIRDEYCEIWDC
ncbi:MAG: hypothetical protein FWC41_03240 [Firmicutes bacterium]|nr:hypothetical protein [Bacillota bacterium]